MRLLIMSHLIWIYTVFTSTCVGLLGWQVNSLSANTADDDNFFYFPPGNEVWNFIQIISLGDNLK